MEQKWVDRMLNRAARRSKAQREASTHYIPCILVDPPVPPQLTVGPVRFLTQKKFFEDYRVKFEQDFRTSHERARREVEERIAKGEQGWATTLSAAESDKISRQTLDYIYDYYKEFDWVAEVSVPPCSREIARERAQATIHAALDLLRVAFAPHGSRFRVGHDSGPVERTAHIRLDSRGEFDWEIARRGVGGLLVKNGWHEPGWETGGWAIALGGAAIEGHLSPEKATKLQLRWLDALYWYGQGMSERIRSAQLVKFVAALERLTVTGKTPIEDVTSFVTRRTALLAQVEPQELPRLNREAREAYRWRSYLMHGKKSPQDPGVESALRTAHRLVPRALLGALLLFHGLGTGGDKELERWYLERERTPVST